MLEEEEGGFLGLDVATIRRLEEEEAAEVGVGVWMDGWMDGWRDEWMDNKEPPLPHTHTHTLSLSPLPHPTLTHPTLTHPHTHTQEAAAALPRDEESLPELPPVDASKDHIDFFAQYVKCVLLRVGSSRLLCCLLLTRRFHLAPCIGGT